MTTSEKVIKERKTLGSVLVIGGCGFLGHHIVDQLLTNDIFTFTSLSVLDLSVTRNRSSDSRVQYYSGDITSEESTRAAFKQANPNVVIHTASPIAYSVGNKKTDMLYQRVNVEGTKNLLDISKAAGVKAFVYTSSASIVGDNSGTTDLINADERWPVIIGKRQTEYYSQTKAEAERLVLAANDPYTFLTLSLRPAGIFGEGDVQLVPGMLKALVDGKTSVQIGDNTNLFDFTYVGNVAWAHILAASSLLLTHSLPADDKPGPDEKVDGEAFFITNGSPVPFWSFARSLWQTTADALAQKSSPVTPPKPPQSCWVLSRQTGLGLANAMDWVSWLIGREAGMRKKFLYSCMTRYFNIDKATVRIGYHPKWTLQEGIERSVDWWVQARLEEQKEK